VALPIEQKVNGVEDMIYMQSFAAADESYSLTVTFEIGRQIGMPPGSGDTAFQYTLNVAGRLDDPAQFADVIVKMGSSGQITRVRDIGRVELGAQTYGQIFTQNGKPAAGLAIFLAPGANALEVAKEVNRRMTELAKAFPAGLVYEIPFDTTVFVEASIDEVYKTLFEATILVLIVILVFLQDWRAMLVPATTVPVTIIGAFAAMWALGFTVNFATLFAVVLAIGIVVDDAIIVVEGAAGDIDKGMTGQQASTAAIQQSFGPIVGITLVLVSVFLPAAFLPGLTGQMYAQFALVIAATAVISAINAVTLKPTQCALWLRPTVPMEKRNVAYRAFNAAYIRLEHGYAWLMGVLVRHALVISLIALAIIAGTVYAFSRIPTGFIPFEDQGYMLATVELPDGASLDRTQRVLDRLSETARKTPGVDQVITIAGVSPLDSNASMSSRGVAYIMLKDWSVRGKEQGLLPMLTSLNKAVSTIEEASIRVLPPPPIQGIGFAAGFTMQINLQDGSADYVKLGRVAITTVDNAAAQSSVQLALSSFRADTPQYAIEVDRVKAQALQVNVDQVFRALSGYLGSRYVNQFTKFGRTFQVFVQADADFRRRIGDIDQLSVRNSAGSMIPLGTLVRIRSVNGPSLISLFNLYPTATVIGLPARGHSSGEMIHLMEQIADKTFPPHVSYLWSAMSYQENLVGNQMYLVFAMALLLVYLVLAGQYESWFRPMAVLFAVPIALLGPVLALTALRIDNNVYTQIGLVLLIALSAKNAILIVEFARELREAGKPLLESAIEAARARFRSILMTSFAFIMGVVPLVLATGAGANARASIGLSVFTGMIASTCLALLFVPSFFVVIQRFEEWQIKRHRKRAEGSAAAS
jgi:HAE1 family hydrophobic/amphiphilic exporter-1